MKLCMEVYDIASKLAHRESGIYHGYDGKEKVMTQFHFSNMTGEFVTMHPMSELSGRDKVALFNRLLDDLGIRERLIESGRKNNMAIIIIDQQLNKAWDTPKPGNMEKAVEAFNTLTPAQQKRMTEDQV